MAYIYDEAKALKWLSIKVNHVAKYFEEKKLTRSEASISSNFNRAAENEAKRQVISVSINQVIHSLILRLFTARRSTFVTHVIWFVNTSRTH